MLGYSGVNLGKKVKTSIALDEDLLKWVDEMVKAKRFANRTHAIEFALKKLMEGRSEWS
jgi:Arc/MetJ-type ribon-helix-helix transcriptional regulator